MQSHLLSYNDFMKHIRHFINTLFLILVCLTTIAQPGTDVELNKPKKYENRKLRSEKTGEKKFTLPRRITQNTFTHYNYYFNANTRLSEVVNRAKAANKDDYSQLLSFYNYSLDATSEDKSELDSIIYKCTAGILLHDLRNDWIDNMYLILAKAYFFRKDLDSAAMTLQYLNFTFAPKEEGGYDLPIGSNASNEGGEFSIATKETKNIFKRAVSRPPSRNESFIWQIRNHIELNELPEAAGVIEILRHDPNFPKRLQTELDEVISYWFYKQQAYDSSAFYLARAISEAEGKAEQARWEFLIAQMYQLSNNPESATAYYEKSIKHTTDPVMDVYARLNSIRINRNENKADFLQENINELIKLAKKDKYENYKDIIYYAAAKMELERNGFAAAQDLLLRSIEFSANNPAQRSASFLLLADLNYDRKHYTDAYNYYDSTNVSALTLQTDKDRATLRKPPLKIIAENLSVINMEDSLQELASLPADKREEILRRKARQLRREKGLKEEDSQPGNAAVGQQPATNLFASDSKNAEFYFYNASSKARGFSEFKTRWGQRPNVDNWRRQSAMRTQINTSSDLMDITKSNIGVAPAGEDISSSSLLNTLPLTQEKLAKSNKSIMDALFTSGQTFQDKLEDFSSAIQAFEELLRRFPDTEYKEQVLFNLVYCYQKTGDRDKSERYRRELLNASPSGKWAQLLKTSSGKKEVSDPATKKYEAIYNLFIEGNFETAKNEKRLADSIYGKNYWTPQLLYIEAIYYIKQRQDSLAISTLKNIMTLYRGTPMEEKAHTMIDVLGRRLYIEDQLTKLDVKRAEETSVSNPPVTKIDNPPVVKPTPPPTVKTDNAPPPVVKTNIPPAVAVPKEVKKDTLSQPAITREPPKKLDTAKAPVIISKNFTFVPGDAHFVIVLLDKVDEVYASEARNAFNRYNKEKFYNQKIDVSSAKLDDRFNLILQGPFSDAAAAVNYVDGVKPVSGSRILPWLKNDKYSFLIISASNLEILKATKDLTAYKQLLQQALPGKF